MNETTAAPAVATAADVRAWAKEAGRTDVAARGRISQDVKHAFTVSTGRSVK